MLTKNLAIQLIESDELFPVDFDEAWQWVGYSTKSNATVALRNNFVQEADYRVIKINQTKADGSFSHCYNKIELSIDCFKSFAMMAGTTKGKEVRRYFIQCERQLKKQQQLTPEQQALQLAKALLASHEENKKLQAKIEVDKPKVLFAEAIEGSEGAINFNKFAKSIGLGRNTMMATLRAMKILMVDSVLPYQKYCERGYFEVSEKVPPNKEVVHFALVTGKGQLWLKNKLDEFTK